MRISTKTIQHAIQLQTNLPFSMLEIHLDGKVRGNAFVP